MSKHICRYQTDETIKLSIESGNLQERKKLQRNAKRQQNKLLVRFGMTERKYLSRSVMLVITCCCFSL